MIDKNHRVNQILKTYERTTFRRGEGLVKTIKLLKENKTLTAREVAQKLNKHKDTAFSRFNRGVRRGLIFREIKGMSYKYLTHGGEVFLENK
ncbi:MAG: hypothetical protein QMD36_01835 [Candidatus Aenigmarchaeota archaeon]|nr:hypothetical protein [Candidatus Aenigmarchaeota archaeon]